MGNETVTKPKQRNKNSYSVDFGHQLPSKIRPNSNTFKLSPIQQPKQRTQGNNASSANADEQQKSRQDAPEVKRQHEQVKKQRSERLKKLNSTNDELRRQLIRISTQLTEKLKKKKFQVKKPEPQETNPKNKERLKKELQNAYKQIDMYKKLLYDLKIGQNSGAKLLDVEDKITAVDMEIEKTMVEIQAIKNVTSNQSAGIRKENDKGSEALQELKKQIQSLKETLKQKSKKQRTKQKVYMQQHHYMKILQQKLRKIDEQDEEDSNNEALEMPSNREIQNVEKQLEQLKIKHDQYHKRINSYLTNSKTLKQGKKELLDKLEQADKMIKGLKYKRDAYVKKIKDNLHLFATAKEQKQEQLSEFQSEEEEEPDPIQEEQQERGTFDVEHLKDHQLKHKSRQQIQKQRSQQEVIRQQVIRSEPKMWKKQLTRIISKGKQMPDQKLFGSGLNSVPKIEMKIIMINVWMNKKKQITAIQPSYLIDGRIIQGMKSSKNSEDQYRVVFEMDEGDYLKSVLGIFGKTGFLEYLVLQSNFGKISKIGREQLEGDNFAIGVTKQETPVQITGANRQDGPFWRISRLDFQVLIETAV